MSVQKLEITRDQAERITELIEESDEYLVWYHCEELYHRLRKAFGMAPQMPHPSNYPDDVQPEREQT